MTTQAGTITHALLLEVDLVGRPARLELTTPTGLLTLHPDRPGRTLHGNVVTADGVRHISFGWGPEHELAVDGRPIASAVSAHRLASTTDVGEWTDVPVVAIAVDLTIREETRRFTRLSATEWRIDGGPAPATLDIDDRGVPIGLAEAAEWPLEVDD